VNPVSISIPFEALKKAWGGNHERRKRQTNMTDKRSAFIFYKDDLLFYSEDNVSSVSCLFSTFVYKTKVKNSYSKS